MATVRLPAYLPYRVRVIARNADLSWLAASSYYSPGLSVMPVTRVPFPINASYASALGLCFRYDFSDEANTPSLSQSDDLSGNGFWLGQSSAARRPVIQPFAHGELSALRMQGTTANPLGYMQVGPRVWGGYRMNITSYLLNSFLR